LSAVNDEMMMMFFFTMKVHALTLCITLRELYGT